MVIGRPSLAEDGALVADAAAAMAAAWPRARFLPALRRGNVMGALDMGLAPGLLPGRVTLDEGRAWFESAWGSVPAGRGRDAAAMLRALADESMEAIVLVGSDPVGDFPDRALAEEALGRAGFVVAVDGFLSPSAALADVVLPVAIAHERTGTTTNIEGRVTRLAQKLVSPGQCWPDWMVASELADRLSGGLGVSSVVRAVGRDRTPVARPCRDHEDRARHARRARRRRRPAARVAGADHDAGFAGAVRPHGHARDRRGRGPRCPAPRGGGRASRWRRPVRLATARRANGSSGGNGSTGADGGGPTRPRSLRWPVAVDAPALPAPDSSSLRLVSARRLYDQGVLVGACRSLAPLAAAATVRVNPYDLATPRRRGRSSGAGPLVARARWSSRPSPTRGCRAVWRASTSTSTGTTGTSPRARRP